jgi:hypothetical protein
MRRLIARIATSIALMVIALIAALVALGYFVFALYLWLAEYLVPPAAALVSGGIVLFIALMMVMIAGALLRGSRRRRRDLPTINAAETAAEIGGLLGDKVHGFANLHRGSSLLTALAAGFAVGVSPKLRSILWRLLRKMT